MTLRLALHGHAYQPPRANPRTGRVPIEVGAAPFRDWNHRITAECYAPCTATRLHDGAGRVTGIVNLFERMSFDLGPTLAHWLEEHAPVVLERIVAGDRVGRTAVAHPYHHVILPLALPRDARTELLWGMADFRHRFGREPEGMWCPETALDPHVVSMLETLGLQFTIVAPHQVAAVPAPGRLGRIGGSAMTLVVYDGGTSHALAFGSALGSADALADQLATAAGTGLVVAATDLETFGHHHRFSERAVGHVLFEIAPERMLHAGGLAPLMHGVERDDVGSVLPSAWSCAHGYERWRSACGCETDGSASSHQRWRGPLRQLLDVLRDHAHEVFARRGAEVFHDAWAARDAYGEVLADRSRWDAFLREHVRPLASEEMASLLLASQEATLASYTSCAWFFADLIRPESAIVLQEAARSVELLALLGEQAPLDEALRCLDVPGAIDGGPRVPASMRTGRDVWDWAVVERGGDEAEAGAAGAGEHLRRWDTRTPVVDLVTSLTEEAVAGSSVAAGQAEAVIDLARRAGDHHLYVVAQQVLYDAIVGRGAQVPAPLVRLGEALGLAVDVVASRIVDQQVVSR